MNKTYDLTILLARLGYMEKQQIRLKKQVLDLSKQLQQVKAYQDNIIEWGGFY